jgi:glucokinase-like ROK family protein
MRRINRSAILSIIRQDGPIRRSQIAQRLNVSLPTVMRVVDDLIDKDLVRLHDSNERTGGRYRPLLEFNGDAYAVVGVDLGGTRMFGAVANLAGAIQHESFISVEDSDQDNSVECLCSLIQTLLDRPRLPGQCLLGLGIGAPGITLSQEGVVTWAPSLRWRDLPLKAILAERFNLPVFVENDVNLATLGELAYGAAQGVRDLVCIAIGTGIGAGIIIDGALYRGHDEASGEIGYMVPGVEFLGRCYDRFGALETLASGTGITERANQLLAESGAPLPSEELDAEFVFAAARAGHAWAQQVVDETVDYLSLAIANVSALLNPELVILGGGVARSADLLIEPILQRLEGVVPFVPRLVASPLGRRAAVLGAIALVLDTTTEHLVVKRLP